MEDEDLVYISPDTIAANLQEREDLLKSHLAESNKLNNVMNEFTQQIRTKTKQRVDILLAASQEGLQKSKQAWLLRDQYKNVVSVQNSALKYLLNRANEALASVSADDDKKAKAKAKKK